MASIPSGWKQDPNNPDIYEAFQGVGGFLGFGSKQIKNRVNVKTGDYTISQLKFENGANVVEVELASYSSDTDELTYAENDDAISFKVLAKQVSSVNNLIKNQLPKNLYTISKEVLTPDELAELSTKTKYNTLQEIIAVEEPESQPPQPPPDKEEEEIKVNINDELNNLNITAKNTLPDFGTLSYPTKINEKQDYIQFTIGKYTPRNLKVGDDGLGTLSKPRSATLDEILATINLPIQPSIVDNNTVDWNGSGLDPIQVGLLQAGINIVEKGGVGVTQSIEALGKTFKDEEGNPNAQLISAFKLKLAQEAAGAQNVLSRFAGGIVNPNMELLFSGPQLRPFNFNFRLSPRDNTEATTVRKIIRAFKQAMAPKVTGTGLFLSAPNIFAIKYVQAGRPDGFHPALNRIKLCALKSCVVDYTPENSYMTFKDGSNTMVSYNMSLAFQELEPVTDADYTMSEDQIGY